MDAKRRELFDMQDDLEAAGFEVAIAPYARGNRYLVTATCLR